MSRAEVAELVSALVAIDSVNPALVPGGAGETAAAALVAAWARAAGLEAEVARGDAGPPERRSSAPAAAAAAARCCCAGTSTRSASRAWTRRTRRGSTGDRLYGRGAYDMKAGVAAALLACRAAAGLGLAGDVVVAAVADEEHASLGVQEALRAVRGRRRRS